MSDKKLNILMAYPYLKRDPLNLLKANEGSIRFLLDSGAFTAWKAGTTIGVDEYCFFLDSLQIKPWRYFSLDVVGDPHKSYENYEIMRKRGYNPIPIFTRGEDPKMIDTYYETSDVLGLGGLVGTKGSAGFVKGVMKLVGDRKVHWLGFTNKNFVSYYKPYMCDSSSWEGGARFGAFSLYMGNGNYKHLKKTDFMSRPEQLICDHLKSYGVNPMDLAVESNWHGGKSINRTLCAHSAVRASMEIEKKLKTYQFIACATSLALELLVDSFKKEIKI